MPEHLIPAEPGWIVVTAYDGGHVCDGHPDGPDWHIDVDLGPVEVLPVVAWALNGWPIVVHDVRGRGPAALRQAPWIEALDPDELAVDDIVLVGIFHPAHRPVPGGDIGAHARACVGEVIRREESDELGLAAMRAADANGGAP